jgi:DNA-binding winged helix-turn-helix (wHTH) protein
MNMQLRPDRLLRFGEFELDQDAGELRRNGTRVSLPEQPFRLLTVLLERPGTIATRDELRERLWGTDTFVDFEHGVNAAVKRLRDALGDSAEQPRYIETVPKRGYRFIASLDLATSPSPGNHPGRGTPDTGDAVLDFAAPSTSPSATRELRTIRPRSRWWLRAGVVGLIVAACVTAWLSWRAPTASRAAQSVMRLPIDLGPDVSLASPVLMSSNGERFVFLSNGRLVTRKLSQEVPVPLAGTEGAQEFFLSPDSQHVGFLVDGKLKRMALDGGAVLTIADLPRDTRGATWGEDGTMVFGGVRAGLTRVPASGTPQPLTRLEPGEWTHRQPQFLPGGRALVFTSHKGPEDFDLARIEVLTLNDGTRRTLQDNGYFGRFVGDAGGTGYLMFFRAGRMWAAAFDPARLVLLGSPFPVLEDVVYDDVFGTAAVDASRTGTLVYRRQSKVRLDWLERDGSTRPLLEDPDYYKFARLSPDGKKVALYAAGSLIVYDIEGRRVTARLTRGIRVGQPIWTPDGRFVIFGRSRGLSWVRSDGPSEPRLLFEAANPPPRFPYSFRREDNRLAYTENTGNTGAGNNWDVWTVKVRSDEAGLRSGEPEEFLVGPDDEGQPQFSLDGRWVAYRSAKTGRSEVYVRGFPKDGHVWPVSTGGGIRPLWSRSELFFQQGDQIMAVPYTVADSRIDFGTPRIWSAHRLAPLGELGGYSVAPDGTRIAAIVPDPLSEPQYARSVTLIINAVEEFRRLAPR